jgi:hypothetical protein
MLLHPVSSASQVGNCKASGAGWLMWWTREGSCSWLVDPADVVSHSTAGLRVLTVFLDIACVRTWQVQLSLPLCVKMYRMITLCT